MTNVSGTPEKVGLRRKLFELGERALVQAGWTVERIQGIGKSSVRRIVKGGESHTVSIRTTQDTWIAFPRNDDDSGWVTLELVDFVVAVTVDDKDNPKFGLVFMVEGNEVRERFDRAYRSRLDAGHSIPVGRGVWVSMFIAEDPSAASSVGGGIALGKKPLLKVSLDAEEEAEDMPSSAPASNPEAPLSIADAKRRLAETFGVTPDKIKIVIEG